jgi:hypothetical protein
MVIVVFASWREWFIDWSSAMAKGPEIFDREEGLGVGLV